MWVRDREIGIECGRKRERIFREREREREIYRLISRCDMLNPNMLRGNPRSQ